MQPVAVYVGVLSPPSAVSAGSPVGGFVSPPSSAAADAAASERSSALRTPVKAAARNRDLRCAPQMGTVRTPLQKPNSRHAFAPHRTALSSSAIATAKVFSPFAAPHLTAIAAGADAGAARPTAPVASSASVSRRDRRERDLRASVRLQSAYVAAVDNAVGLCVVTASAAPHPGVKCIEPVPEAASSVAPGDISISEMSRAPDSDNPPTPDVSTTPAAAGLLAATTSVAATDVTPVHSWLPGAASAAASAVTLPQVTHTVLLSASSRNTPCAIASPACTAPEDEEASSTRPTVDVIRRLAFQHSEQRHDYKRELTHLLSLHRGALQRLAYCETLSSQLETRLIQMTRKHRGALSGQKVMQHALNQLSALLFLRHGAQRVMAKCCSGGNRGEATTSASSSLLFSRTAVPFVEFRRPLIASHMEGDHPCPDDHRSCEECLGLRVEELGQRNRSAISRIVELESQNDTASHMLAIVHGELLSLSASDAPAVGPVVDSANHSANNLQCSIGHMLDRSHHWSAEGEACSSSASDTHQSDDESSDSNIFWLTSCEALCQRPAAPAEASLADPCATNDAANWLLTPYLRRQHAAQVQRLRCAQRDKMRVLPVTHLSPHSTITSTAKQELSPPFGALLVQHKAFVAQVLSVATSGRTRCVISCYL